MEIFNIPIKYDINPHTNVPYNSGKISKLTYDNALKYLNSLRFAAGLSHNIGVIEKYNTLAQDASLLCEVNQRLAHTAHPKPKNMNKNLYNSGAKGCSESNLGNGYTNLPISIFGWVSDSDSNNFDRVGHRRWVLNPTMENTGLGLVGKFSAMYAFDHNSFKNSEENVAWPCQNMPIEFFGDNYPWSLSVNKILTKKVKVTIINNITKEVTKFENYTPDKFCIENSRYGQPGCIIFRPNFKYNDGDSFRVDVNCTDFSVSYDVNFFNLKCVHDKELLGTIKSSCIKKGKLIYFCDKCGVLEDYLDLEPHKEEIISFTKANCKTKGRKKYKCCYCNQTFDKEIGIQPHDYTFREIENSSKTEGICKDCGKKIQFTPPTKVNLWFKKENDSSYSSAPPRYKPIGSDIIIWVDVIYGDKDYNEIIFEVSDKSLLKLPEKIENNPNNYLKVTGSGTVKLTYYPKYNPTLKRSFTLTLG